MRAGCFGRSMSTSVGSFCAVARRRLEEHEACRLNAKRQTPIKPAAVLVPLFMNHADQKLSVLLTLRSSQLRHHSGEVALPGGRFDEGDRDPVDTALREAREEIGMHPHQVDVCTQLPIHLARGSQAVIPVVGMVPENFQARLQTSEVEAVFRAPLEMFLGDPSHMSNRIEYRTRRFLMHSFHYKDMEHGGREFKIWGFTAQVLISVASMVWERRPDFECILMNHSPVLPPAEVSKL